MIKSEQIHKSMGKLLLVCFSFVLLGLGLNFGSSTSYSTKSHQEDSFNKSHLSFSQKVEIPSSNLFFEFEEIEVDDDDNNDDSNEKILSNYHTPSNFWFAEQNIHISTKSASFSSKIPLFLLYHQQKVYDVLS